MTCTVEVPAATVAAAPVWKTLLDDDMPILIVVGDYYIFGEVDERGHEQRDEERGRGRSPAVLPRDDAPQDAGNAQQDFRANVELDQRDRCRVQDERGSVHA